MSQMPLDVSLHVRNHRREKAMDYFRRARAIYHSEQDPRERVQMKRRSYVQFKLALAEENDLILDDTIYVNMTHGNPTAVTEEPAMAEKERFKEEVVTLEFSDHDISSKHQV